MKKTKDYEIFKKKDLNRPLDESNLIKIENSVKARNLLHLRPILVNKQMEVVDGQHRLEVAKKLGLEIFYEVHEDSQDEDIILLNANQTRWKLDDYLNYFCQKNYEDYIKLKEFMNENQIGLQIAIALIGKESRGKFFDRFKIGKFTFPLDIQKIKEKKLKVDEIVDLLKRKIIGNSSFLLFPAFYGSLIFFISLKDVNVEVFKQKLEEKLDAFRKCSTKPAYLELFKSIYNYKNRNPLRLGELIEREETT